ncbi:hypothetical protein LTR62_007550 [Meristemomyces frigidus]|uniref:Uncharacterized protein n=1 Tax=Meristemomyces frigidus TaxID=1508187 RepID=A0AAN7TC51_9PEZI|nr:hypothetical protein LTR62_007550 [Meristemomyces frigidus]
MNALTMPRQKDGTDPQNGKNVQLQFIHLTEPGEAKDRKFQRQVRAHVTRLQHRQTRNRNRQNSLRGASESQALTPGLAALGTSLQSTETLEEPPSDAPSNSAENAQDLLRTYPVVTNYQPGDGNDEQTNLQQDAAPVNSEAQMLALKPWRLPENDLANSFSRGEAAYRTFALYDSGNVVGRTVSALELDYSSVMSLYRSIALTQAQDFARQFGLAPDPKASSTRIYRLAHMEPAALLAVALIGVRNMLQVTGRKHVIGKDHALVIDLERHLISSINNALQDPSRRISDQMLVTVALCAAYEVKHGDATRYDIHMTGLLQMVNLRGGFPEIGRYDMYIVRLLVWIDLNTAQIAGRSTYLQDMYAGLESTNPHANVAMFRRPRLRGTIQEIEE